MPPLFLRPTGVYGKRELWYNRWYERYKQTYIWPNIGLIVRWLKGGTAYQLFRECPELQRSYWKKEGRHLWSPSYYVESIGAVKEQAVAKYIDDQRKKEVELE